MTAVEKCFTTSLEVKHILSVTNDIRLASLSSQMNIISKTNLVSFHDQRTDPEFTSLKIILGEKKDEFLNLFLT